MCRNIRPLFHFEPPTTDDEIHAAALQYVRKVTGSTRPSRANQAAFDRAVAEIAAITARLVRADLVTTAAPRTREAVAAKARQRGQQRDARTARRLATEGALLPVEVPAEWVRPPPATEG
jgi:hypothetical protein